MSNQPGEIKIDLNACDSFVKEIEDQISDLRTAQNMLYDGAFSNIGTDICADKVNEAIKLLDLATTWVKIIKLMDNSD